MTASPSQALCASSPEGRADSSFMVSSSWIQEMRCLSLWERWQRAALTERVGLTGNEPSENRAKARKDFSIYYKQTKFSERKQRGKRNMGKFTFTETEIPGVVVIEPQVFGDDRGYFMETYQKDQFAAAGIDKEFVQDNQSRSTRGVLRGLHFQKNHTQGKLVRVTKGEVYDVAVDCRPHSATFGKWVGVTLSEDNKKMFYIPEGFAHGFLVLSDVAEFCYKCTDVYDPTSEGGIPYDDPTVNVQWPDCGCEHKTSAKDKLHEPFAAQKFEYFEKW